MAEYAFTGRAQSFKRRLTALVSCVDSELHPSQCKFPKCIPKESVLDSAVDAHSPVPAGKPRVPHACTIMLAPQVVQAA